MKCSNDAVAWSLSDFTGQEREEKDKKMLVKSKAVQSGVEDNDEKIEKGENGENGHFLSLGVMYATVDGRDHAPVNR